MWKAARQHGSVRANPTNRTFPPLLSREDAQRCRAASHMRKQTKPTANCQTNTTKTNPTQLCISNVPRDCESDRERSTCSHARECEKKPGRDLPAKPHPRIARHLRGCAGGNRESMAGSVLFNPFARERNYCIWYLCLY